MTKAKTVAKAQAAKGLKSLKPSVVVEPVPATKITRKVFQIDTGDAPVTKADLAALVAAFQAPASQVIELSPEAIERIVKATGTREDLSATDKAKQPAAVLSPVAQESADLDAELSHLRFTVGDLVKRLKPVLPDDSGEDEGSALDVADDGIGVPDRNMHQPTRVVAVAELRSKRREVQALQAEMNYLLKYIAV